MCQKKKLLILSNIFFCHYVFKKPSAAEASESVYMRERVNTTYNRSAAEDVEKFSKPFVFQKSSASGAKESTVAEWLVLRIWNWVSRVQSPVAAL